jgi:hypothetical protein
MGLGIFSIAAYCNCQDALTPSKVPPSIQAQLDQHCLEAANAWSDSDARSEDQKTIKRDAFYSWQLNTCVETTIETKPWSYEMRDATYGFFRPPKWIEAKIPLSIIRDESIGWVSAEGYWESIDPSPEKRLVSRIAAKIDCTRGEGICREIDAEITIGTLGPDSSEYRISNWDKTGIVAEDEGHGSCSMGHRLMIDFKTNAISVVDYPTKIASTKLCEAFQTVNSYALHGGSYMLMGSNTIFYCDGNGADSALLSKVREQRGDISELTYSLWQDNGEGGPPATVKTPEKPYSQNRCAQLFKKKLEELGSAR